MPRSNTTQLDAESLRFLEAISGVGLYDTLGMAFPSKTPPTRVGTLQSVLGIPETMSRVYGGGQVQTGVFRPSTGEIGIDTIATKYTTATPRRTLAHEYTHATLKTGRFLTFISRMGDIYDKKASALDRHRGEYGVNYEEVFAHAVGPAIDLLGPGTTVHPTAIVAAEERTPGVIAVLEDLLRTDLYKRHPYKPSIESSLRRARTAVKQRQS